MTLVRSVLVMIGWEERGALGPAVASPIALPLMLSCPQERPRSQEFLRPRWRPYRLGLMLGKSSKKTHTNGHTLMTRCAQEGGSDA